MNEFINGFVRSLGVSDINDDDNDDVSPNNNEWARWRFYIDNININDVINSYPLTCDDDDT